jgi:hypothetical protein
VSGQRGAYITPRVITTAIRDTQQCGPRRRPEKEMEDGDRHGQVV